MVTYTRKDNTATISIDLDVADLVEHDSASSEEKLHAVYLRALEAIHQHVLAADEATKAETAKRISDLQLQLDALPVLPESF